MKKRHPLMKRHSWILTIGIIVLICPMASSQSFDGQWTRTSLRFSVNVESWGKNCGVRPQSYYNSAKKDVDILQNKGHLFFSTGGLRTDKCNSPNPTLTVVSQRTTGTSWKRVCETPKSASKYEKIDYELTASGHDKLTYVAHSKFNWTLSNDHCVVSWTEKRVYQRKGGTSPPPVPESVDNSPVVRVHEAEEATTETEDSNEAGCQQKGSVRRLILFPQGGTISPGERLCFQVRGVDEAGCRFPVTVRWSASQDGQPKNQMITKGGCFLAGKNAAEALGRYRISARTGQVSAQTSLTVAYPDIGDLARARINLAADLDAIESDSAATAEEGAQPHDEQVKSVDTVSGDGVDNGFFPIVWAIIAGLLAAATIALLMVKRRQRRAAVLHRQLLRREDRVCPVCNRSWPATHETCPTDGAALVAPTSLSADDSETANRPLICPTCHRGYDNEAAFCPHDATRLVPYEDWKDGEI